MIENNNLRQTQNNFRIKKNIVSSLKVAVLGLTLVYGATSSAICGGGKYNQALQVAGVPSKC